MNEHQWGRLILADANNEGRNSCPSLCDAFLVWSLRSQKPKQRRARNPYTRVLSCFIWRARYSWQTCSLEGGVSDHCARAVILPQGTRATRLAQTTAWQSGSENAKTSIRLLAICLWGKAAKYCRFANSKSSVTLREVEGPKEFTPKSFHSKIGM